MEVWRQRDPIAVGGGSPGFEFPEEDKSTYLKQCDFVCKYNILCYTVKTPHVYFVTHPI